MIVLKTAFGEQVTLDHGKFSVPDSAALESLLNTLAKAHPVLNGGSPDPDFDLLQNLDGIAPAMEIVDNDTPEGSDDDDSGIIRIH